MATTTSNTVAIEKNELALSKPKTLRRASLEHYLDKEARATEKHEFYNGKIVLMPGAKATHSQVAAQFGAALFHNLEDFKTTHIIYNSDMKIYIPLYNHAVYPDAVVVCEAPEYWNGREDMILNPILIVEVLSNSTEGYDRGNKFMKYKTLESFKEYVLVRQDRYHVETWHREAPGLWRETIEEDKTKEIKLASLGISLSLSKIYKNINL